MTNQEVAEHVKQVQGEMLTLVEASYTDPEQRVAMKRLVSKVFSRKLLEIFEPKGGRTSD